MKSREEAIFNMFRATLNVGTDNNTFVLTIPNLDADFAELANRIKSITGLISLQAAVLSGIAIDKSDLKQKMALLTYNYSGPGRAWAAANGDDTNYKALDISHSKIIRAADDVAGPLCLTVYNILDANAAALVPFGLSAPMISELDAAITDYIASVPLPTNAINIRQTYTDNISEQIRDTSLFLERQLDNIVRGQINTNPDFVKTYFNGREIIDPPTNSTTFRFLVHEVGVVSPPAPGKPVINVRIAILNTDKITHTDINGKAELKQFKKGIYTILATADGFRPQQQVISIGLGEVKDVTFILQPL